MKTSTKVLIGVGVGTAAIVGAMAFIGFVASHSRDNYYAEAKAPIGPKILPVYVETEAVWMPSHGKFGTIDSGM